jgi:hypothetical protein
MTLFVAIFLGILIGSLLLFGIKSIVGLSKEELSASSANVRFATQWYEKLRQPLDDPFAFKVYEAFESGKLEDIRMDVTYYWVKLGFDVKTIPCWEIEGEGKKLDASAYCRPNKDIAPKGEKIIIPFSIPNPDLKIKETYNLELRVW